MRDPLTYRYPRTLIEAFGCDATQAVAIHKYPTPLPKRFFFALIRHGWMLVVAALLVFGNDAVCCLQNVPSTAVVLLEFYDGTVFVILFKPQNITKISATPRIYTLPVVPYNG